VLGHREAALAHLLGIFARCRPDLVAQAANFGVNSVKRPSMSSITRICPSQAGEPPIPIALFREYSTAAISPELLAALAQVGGRRQSGREHLLAVAADLEPLRDLPACRSRSAPIKTPPVELISTGSVR
jgi:hypothetical protein